MIITKVLKLYQKNPLTKKTLEEYEVGTLPVFFLFFGFWELSPLLPGLL